jgi:transcriptional regulator with XRE-family HTH domain
MEEKAMDENKNANADPASLDASERKKMGARLREAREYVGLSQDEVAKTLSIPRTALSNIETGQRRIDVLELKKLARLYKRPVEYFTGEEKIDQSLPAGVARLAQTAVGLSQRDRQEVTRFAEYLRAKARVESENDD